MTEAQTISWIFLSAALASQEAAVTTEEIAQVADGINHLVPTQKEMRLSLSWLTTTGYLEKTGKKYSLTEAGKDEFKSASVDRKELFKIWKALEERFEPKADVKRNG